MRSDMLMDFLEAFLIRLFLVFISKISFKVISCMFTKVYVCLTLISFEGHTSNMVGYLLFCFLSHSVDEGEYICSGFRGVSLLDHYVVDDGT